MKLNKGLFFALTIVLLVAALPVSAALPTLVPECARTATQEAPALSCFLELGVNISTWILGLTGSLALLFFIYGGFLFLISHGNEQSITKGKTILTQATVGIIIIFGAYIGIKFIVSALGASKYFNANFEIEKPITPVLTPSKSTILPPSSGPGVCECKTAVKTPFDTTPGKIATKVLLNSAETLIKQVCSTMQGTVTMLGEYEDTVIIGCSFSSTDVAKCVSGGEKMQDEYNKLPAASTFGVSCAIK